MGELKHTITTAAKETLGNLKQQPRKPWISEKTVTLIEQRRKHKYDKNKSEYNRLRNLINRKAKKDKEEWLGQYCEEIENSLIGEILNNLIRKLFGKVKLKSTIIKSKEETTVIEDEEIADRWQQYVEELYIDSEELEEL